MYNYLVTMSLDSDCVPKFFDVSINIESKLKPEDIDDLKEDLANQYNSTYKDKLNSENFVVMNIYEF